MKRTLTCIGCPMGCQVTVDYEGETINSVVGNTSQISYALTAGIGGVLCALGRFDVGGLAVFVNYSRQFSRPINELSHQMSTIFSALAGAERVFGIMDRNPEPVDPEHPADASTMRGDVVLENAAGTGVSVIATKNVPKK